MLGGEEPSSCVVRRHTTLAYSAAASQNAAAATKNSRFCTTQESDDKMGRSFKDFVGVNVNANGFSLGARDAYETAKNISSIFVQRAKWFRQPDPIHLDELRDAYKNLCPGMEQHFPGIVDKIFQREIITQLGFSVGASGLVQYRS